MNNDGANAYLSDKTKMSSAALINSIWSMIEPVNTRENYREIFEMLCELRERHVTRPAELERKGLVK